MITWYYNSWGFVVPYCFDTVWLTYPKFRCCSPTPVLQLFGMNTCKWHTSSAYSCLNAASLMLLLLWVWYYRAYVSIYSSFKKYWSFFSYKRPDFQNKSWLLYTCLLSFNCGKLRPFIWDFEGVFRPCRKPGACFKAYMHFVDLYIELFANNNNNNNLDTLFVVRLKLVHLLNHFTTQQKAGLRVYFESAAGMSSSCMCWVGEGPKRKSKHIHLQRLQSHIFLKYVFLGLT